MGWTVRGRAAVVEDVRARLAAGAGVVLAGAAGVGKTTIAREVATHLDCRWVVGTPALASIPLGAFAHVLDGDDEQPIDDPLSAIRSGAAAIERSGTELVVVDDLPLLDGRSLALVQHLVRRGRVRVLATVRDRLGVRAEVRSLWWDRGLSVVDVGQLEVEDVAAVLDAVLDGPVDPRLPSRLHELTGGNALLLREAVESGRADGSLTEVDGLWAWTGVRQPSTGLVEAVQARLAGVGDVGVEAGDLLAMGEPLPADVFVGVAGAAAVEALEAAGVVRVDDVDGGVRFSHPLYGEVIAAALGVARRRRLWIALADALEPAAVSATDDLRVARWRLGGGGDWPAERWLAAAEGANHRFDHELAGALAQKALDTGGGWRASLALASALVGSGQSDAAQSLLVQMGDGASTDEERMEQAVALYHARSAAIGFQLEIADDLRRAEDAMDDPDNRRFLQAQRSTLLVFAGDVAGGRRLADEVLAELGDRADPAAAGVRLRLAIPLGVSSILTGRTREAVTYCGAQLGVALGLTDRVPAGPVWCATTMVQALITGRWLDEADATLDLLRTILDEGDWSDWFRDRAAEFLTTVEGMVLMARGRVPEALAVMDPILESTAADPAVSHQITEAAAALGDADLLRRATEGIQTYGGTWPGYTEMGSLSMIWAEAAQGTTSAAGDRAVEAMGTAIDRGLVTVALYLGHAAVRLGRASDVRAELEALAPECDVACTWSFVRHAAAAAEGDGDDLEGVGSDLADAGLLLLAAEAYDGARVAHSAHGRPRDAARAGAAASALLERCGGFRPPWLGVVDTPTPLTRREDEVVKLAAQGLTSSSIAERLHVSTRTVEGHLLRAYQKLGVRSREDLARIVGPDAAPTDDGTAP